MTEELKQEIIQLIRENLKIECKPESGWYRESWVEVILSWDGNKIYSDSITLPRCDCA